MERIRNSARYGLAVLTCFALILITATLGPILHPVAARVLCTADEGVRTVFMDSDGRIVPAHHAMDCPLCLPSMVATGRVLLPLRGPRPPSSGPVMQPDRPVSLAIGPPLPARGPPGPLLNSRALRAV